MVGVVHRFVDRTREVMESGSAAPAMALYPVVAEEFIESQVMPPNLAQRVPGLTFTDVEIFTHDGNCRNPLLVHPMTDDASRKPATGIAHCLSEDRPPVPLPKPRTIVDILTEPWEILPHWPFAQYAEFLDRMGRNAYMKKGKGEVEQVIRRTNNALFKDL